MSHKHYWSYLHTVYSDDGGPDSVHVVRYCECGAKQRAFATEWERLPRNHDARQLIASDSAVKEP